MAESDIALLTEHFGYPPVSLLDDIINSINVLAERALGSVEKGLINAAPQGLGFKQAAAVPPQKPTRSSRNATTDPTPDTSSSSIVLSPEEAARHEIENGTHQLETLLCSSIDRNFDKFELYVMQNILCIRPSEPREWIRLGHYEGLDLENATATTTSADDESQQDGRPSLNGIRRLRRRLQASQQLNAMLHVEKARNAALLEALRGVVGGPGAALEKKKSVEEEEGGKTPAAAEPTKMEVDGEQHVDLLRADTKPPFGFLHDTGGLAAGASDKPLETTTAFTLSQLQALRALSTSLRSIMPGIETPRDGEEDDGGRKSWRRQRMEYVETATRKHLEQARGLELGKHGEVRDGEWQGEGQRLAKDEVEGLEKAVAMLGGAGAPGTSNEDAMDES